MAQEMVGATVEELEELARTLTGAAHTLDGLRDTVSGRVRSVRWDGPDGHRLRGEWDQRLRPSLDGVAAALRHAHDHVRAQAQQQRDASGGTLPSRGGWQNGIGNILPWLGFGGSAVGSAVEALTVHGLPGRLRFLTQPNVLKGRYTDEWRTVIKWFGDGMKWKSNPVLHWVNQQDIFKKIGALDEPLKAVGRLGTAGTWVGATADAVAHWQAGDQRHAVGDLGHAAASTLKSKPTLVTYIGGVAVESFTQVIEEGEMPRLDEPWFPPNPLTGSNWQDVWVPTGKDVGNRLFDIFKPW